MKRGFGKGFGAGILAAVLVVGLSVTALAATRTIQVNDDIKVTLNGANFTPKDANGKEVPLFSYNGTTYAPVRAICEAAGLKVDYDSATYTAVLTTQDQYIASTPDASNYITAEQAKSAALSHAGVSANDAIFVKAGLDWDDGKVQYEVEFYAGNTEYDYDIDAVSGAVLSYDREWDDFSLKGYQNTDSSTGTGSTSQSNLITEEKAKEIALAKAPAGATVVKCKLDRDDGRYVYEIEMRSGYMEYECDINAVTGVIIDWDADWDD
ncbi:PepSY domain-containing protein [Flavonifractor sp. An82]|uniref:PepSY domain-containing protein n=1 Tax=Flavonifractor sp. An82 TaxID=1965660 RepID=UPI001FA86459|nr:PepSY domain-containing protein [Flavonifractor sp. An82]